MIRAMFRAVTSNGSVHSTTARLPNCSNVIPSCKLHVEQEPQSPKPVMRKSTSLTARARMAGATGALAFDLE